MYVLSPVGRRLRVARYPDLIGLYIVRGSYCFELRCTDS
jgi:hypothetical protein